MSLQPAPHECIVVDDGSTDHSAQVAAAFGAQVLCRAHSGGPAAARNLGAASASGDWLLFLDADVVPHPDLLVRLNALLSQEPHLAACFGSYDDQPAAPGLVSQFRNLLHHFTHQNGCPEARTFWAGCGAIRRDIFLAHRGFDESYRDASIEDIELGARLTAAGHRILLSPDLQVRHLKRWTLRSMVSTDVFHRALPWARLIFRQGETPNDLNTRWSQRFSALFAWLFLAAAFGSPWFAALVPVSICALLFIGIWNAGWLRFLLQRRGLLFAVASFPLLILYLLYSSAAFGAALVAATLESPRRVREQVR
jgi:glycosyltransferase involved in cell wall biosynthesis